MQEIRSCKIVKGENDLGINFVALNKISPEYMTRVRFSFGEKCLDYGVFSFAGILLRVIVK